MTDPDQQLLLRDAIGHAMARISTDVRQQRPVETRCPCCGRPNPCPLHLYAEQVAYCRERNL